MEQKIKIRCKNNNKIILAKRGSTLEDIYSLTGLNIPYGPVSARVNNKVEGLHFCVYQNKDVEYLGLNTPSGIRTYTRSLFMVLCKAVHDLYPGSEVIIDIPISNGYYCNLSLGHKVEEEDVYKIRNRMSQIIEADLPIQRFESTTEEAIDMFAKLGDEAKVKLLKSSTSLYSVFYVLDDYIDYYYGSMLTKTKEITLFGLELYYDGVLLRIPSVKDPSTLGEIVKQDKMFEVFKEHHRWQNIIGISTVGDFNDAVSKGLATDLVNVSEALQEKKISHIADSISINDKLKVVLIAGPSSSGKTTFCKRLSIQLLACGIKPIQISLDDYFVNRIDTPKDENGEEDYESLYSLNINLINEQFNALFSGEEVELPKYNFQTGISEKKRKTYKDV